MPSPHTLRTALSPAATCPELEELRSRLDRLDEELLGVVDARVQLCVEIARVKGREGIGMMQPQRIGLVQRRAAEYARTHDVDGAFLRRLYEVMIAETCRVEDEVIAAERRVRDADVPGPTSR